MKFILLINFKLHVRIIANSVLLNITEHENFSTNRYVGIFIFIPLQKYKVSGSVAATVSGFIAALTYFVCRLVFLLLVVALFWLLVVAWFWLLDVATFCLVVAAV